MQDLFGKYRPRGWNPDPLLAEPRWYSLPSNHGVSGKIVLHNANDRVNRKRTHLKQSVVDYVINTTEGPVSHTLFTNEDILKATYPFTVRGDRDKENKNLPGDLAERIARRVTKYFLRHLHPTGKIVNLFGTEPHTQNRNGFIVRNTEDLILKVEKYPNLLLLKKREDAQAFAYRSIKELDGLFEYELDKQRHLIVLESKLNKMDVDPKKLISDLFEPFAKLFTNTTFSYLFMGTEDVIFTKRERRFRIMNPSPLNIYKHLQQHNIESAFLSFNESRSDLDSALHHLIAQYHLLRKEHAVLYGRTQVSDRRIEIYDGGERPFKTLQRDEEDPKIWRES